MGCDWIKRKGQITGVNYQGKPSKLFKQLEETFGIDEAIKMYEVSRSTEFTDMFGQEPSVKTLVNFITNKNKETTPLTKEDRVDIIEMGSVPNTSAFYDNLGIFTIDEQKLKSAGYNSYEIKELKNNTELQDKVKSALERLQNTQDLEATPTETTETTNEFNSFGKLKPINQNIVQKEVINTLGGIAERRIFDEALNEIQYPNFQMSVNRDTLFQEMQRYKIAEVYTEVDGEIRPENNTETEQILPLVVKLSNNKSLFLGLDTLTSLDLDILQDNEVQTRQVLSDLENNLIGEGLDVIGLKDKAIDQEMQLFLVPLFKFLSAPNKENTKEFSEVYDKYFEKDIAPKIEKIKSDKTDRVFVKLKTNLSEEDVYKQQGLIKAGEDLWIKTAKEDLQTLYNNLRTYVEKYPKDITLEEYVSKNLPVDFNNVENAEAVVLYKMYFDVINDVINDAVNDASNFTGDYQYLTNEYISDFHIAHLKEKQKNSPLYKNFYSNFGVNKDGIYLVNNDNITLEKVKIYADENLKNYSLLSKQMPNLKEAGEIENRRDKVINNPNLVSSFEGQIYTLANDTEIIAKNTTEEFIKINKNIYEKVDNIGDLSLYLQINTNVGSYNQVNVEQPTTETDLSFYQYLNESPGKFTDASQYLKKTEKNKITEENFNCK